MGSFSTELILLHPEETGKLTVPFIRNEQLKPAAIKPPHLNIIIKNIARESQLPNADDYSSHSLRRGFATEASKNGAPFGSIMRQVVEVLSKILEKNINPSFLSEGEFL